MNVNSQESSQASSSQSRPSQEESLSEGNRDSHQEGDTQSAGPEIRESSRSTTMSSTEQMEVLSGTSGGPEEHKDQENELCEEETLSQTDLDKCGDVDCQDNEQVSSQANSSQDQPSQEGNSDSHQEGDTQNTGPEIRESSRLTEQIEVLSETSGDLEEQNDQENEPCEEETLSQTDLDKCGDVDSQDNEQGSSQANSSQEESLSEGNRDLHQEGDTQSAGPEIGESSRLTRISSTEQIEELKFFLVDSVELNERIHQAWVEERASCVQRIELLSQEIQELQLELERTSACQVPTPCLCSLLCKKNRVVIKKNQKLKDKCKKLKGLSLETVKLKVIVEEQVQELDECESNRKKIQAWKSEKKSMFERMKEKETLRRMLAALEEEEDTLVLKCERERLARVP